MAVIWVTGGTGFVGDALISALIARGDQPICLTRNPERARARHGALAQHVQYVDQIDAFEEVPDAMINLSGEGIADQRWTDRRKRQLRASRIGVTHALKARLATLGGAPATVVTGSAVGYYGHSDQPLTEVDPASHDFSARLCADWEAEASDFASLSALYTLRIGVVMGLPGGFLGRLQRPFSLGLGGRLGHGRQMLSWIHRDDLVALILWCLDGRGAPGVYNATAPNPISNAEFTRALGAALHRPTWMTVPEAPLRLVLGELADLLFRGQAVYPTAAEAAGFEFRYKTLESALSQLFR
jgi:uncharacterized protein